MFTFTGTIKIIGPLQQGGGQGTGRPWQRQTIVLEQENNSYLDVIAVDATDHTHNLPEYAEGDTVEVGFVLRSREYNGKWYTDVRMVYMDHLDPQGRKTPDNIPYRKIAEAKAKNTPEPAPAEAAGDDLPF